ncbi:MAG: ATP-dependent DNA helicase RecG, partial [Proteobacteria bacterium]|nr:ATP-dependent DNA helicase RecG [Pseudomonadota bacterium]
TLHGVGAALAEKLARLGLNNTFDLLFHLPSRFEDRTRVTPVYQLRHGQQGLILGTIEGCQVQFGRRRSLLVGINDEGAYLTMRLFYFNAQQQRALQNGQWIQCFGEARQGAKGLEMVHPEYRVYSSEPENISSDTLTPVYPVTEGITHARIRKLILAVLDVELQQVEELLPPEMLAQHHFMPLADALRTLHTPRANDDLSALSEQRHPAQHRLALEELLAHHLALRKLKQKRAVHAAPHITNRGESWNRLRPGLGFDLTAAQIRAISEIEQDFSLSRPALRLIQGDVGCGKTVVAAAAALQAVDSGYQVAIMAPTELLAEQHRRNFKNWCMDLGISVGWLSSRLPAAEKKAARAAIESGEVQIAIGTHALFQQSVNFRRLGLIIVDEQHRFGVDQRLALKNKGRVASQVPHQLIMSATPIPRSLSMVYYADLDVSNIDELPPGRKPVNTVVLPNTRREDVQERIRVACAEGRQAYWVCPLIEESETLQAQAATETAALLGATLNGIKVELIHGKMKAAQKDRLMQAFRGGEIDLLVATTVIEVGVDVPNASLMIIENAERLGLAQLHQLRGRVGRGQAQAVCVLMYQSPLGKTSRRRLDIMRQTNDGFEIARHDLEFRGPGELMGTRQTGDHQLKVANIVRDQALLPLVEQTAGALIENHPENVDLIIDRWVRHKAHYAEV